LGVRKRVIVAAKGVTLWSHPCLTPLSYKGFTRFWPELVHRIFTEYGYDYCMLIGSRASRKQGAGAPAAICEDAEEKVSFSLSHDDLLASLPTGGEEYLQSRMEWQLANRVAASKGLCKSSFLPRFLLYVCEQHLSGNSHEITEQRIGTQIFHRPSDYNPGEDNIVRSYARMLRKRLDEYFEQEGCQETMRLTIPRGGYVPVFKSVPENRRSQAATHEPATLELPEELSPVVNTSVLRPVTPTERVTGSKAHWRTPWISIFVGMMIGAILVSLMSEAWLRSRSTQPRTLEPEHALWTQLFQQDRNTLIVPSDSGLGILQNVTGKLAGVEEYANGSYLANIKPMQGLGIGNLNDLRGQRYTSVVALNITSRLIALPEFAKGRPQIRYARGITIEDLKNSNAILLGSSHTNPWVSLFDNRVNFKLEYTSQVDQSSVLNKHPLRTESPRYFNGTGNTANQTYGVIDYLPGLDGSGHTLIIQGLNMAATQAAADTLFNAEVMKPILHKASLPNGDLMPFELLVETKSIEANAPEAQIVAARFYSR
jgi:hypothetical protein